MTATPEGPEWGNLPWCPLDPVHDDELARKAYVDRAGEGMEITDFPGLREKLDDIKNKFNSVAAALAGKMPTAPTDGKKYAGAGGSWVEAAEPPFWVFVDIPFTVPDAGLVYVHFGGVIKQPLVNPVLKVNGTSYPLKIVEQIQQIYPEGLVTVYAYATDNSVAVNTGDYVVIDSEPKVFVQIQYHAN